jgi:hypothetical protein
MRSCRASPTPSATASKTDLRAFEHRLLGHARHLHAGSEHDLSVVGPRGSRDDLQEAGLAGAVPADEADVLAGSTTRSA